MSKILLQNDAHIFQMLGTFDSGNGYALPKDIAEILLKIPKKPIVSKDEIDVGLKTFFLESTFEIEGSPVQFCLENSTLFLLERASEMGGLAAFSYLTPLCELTLDYFKNLDARVDLTPLKERIKQRRLQYGMILSEHERLAQGAMRRAQKTLTLQPIPEFQEMLSAGKRFIRLGKPDFKTSSLQMLDLIIDKKNLTHPAAEIIKRWKTSCNNKTSAALVADTVPELHKMQTTDTKKPGSKGKSIDFNLLLAAMLKQDKPSKPTTRIKPSEKAAEILNAEHEVEHDFEPEEAYAATSPTEQDTQEEIKLQQLVSQLLENQKNEAVTAVPIAKLKGKKQAVLSEHAPASSNHDRGQ